MDDYKPPGEDVAEVAVQKGVAEDVEKAPDASLQRSIAEPEGHARPGIQERSNSWPHDQQPNDYERENTTSSIGNSLGSDLDGVESETAGSHGMSAEDPTVHQDQSRFTGKTGSRSSDMNLASLTSASDASSPLHSTYASSTSLQSSHASTNSTANAVEASYRYLKDVPLSFERITAGYSVPSQATPPASITPTTRPGVSQSQQDGPPYSAQAFAALHEQVNPQLYRPTSLRARPSYPPQRSDASSDSSRKSRDHIPMASGPRTAGFTHAQSPGLFSPLASESKHNSGSSKDLQYSTPLLHPTHLQPPKETNKLIKDVDAISGRKIFNTYEVLTKLGSGAHGTVKLGRDLHTSELVAIKIVRRFSKKVRLGRAEDPEDQVRKEVAVLKKARHPHVVSLLEVIDDTTIGKVYLILEFVERGEIVWRKPTSKDIILFEMARARREIENGGNIDNEFEARKVVEFNEHLPQRRMDMEQRLAEQSRLANESVRKERKRWGKEEDTSITPFWRLEYGAESDDEKEKAFSSKISLTETSEVGQPRSVHGESSPSDSATPRANASIYQNESLATSTHLFHPSETPGSSATTEPSITNLSLLEQEESSLQHAFKHDKETVFDATLDRIIAEQTPLTEEEEEYRYIPCLTLPQALEVFRDTVLGLEYLHYQGIIHRDIKPANLLWTSDYRVKISDFGVSYLGKPMREDENHHEIAEADSANVEESIELAKTVGTPAFYAPELCDPELFDSDKTTSRPHITGQIDVWALGVTLYGIVFGRLPFFDTNEFIMYEKIARHSVFIPSMRLKGVEHKARVTKDPQKRSDDFLEYEEVDEELQDLLKRLLHKRPSKRITLKEVKHHPWVLRGITDISRWIEETDPSLQNHGKKIEVTKSEITDAVAPLTIFDQIKRGLKRFNSVVRGRDSRKRGESNAKRDDASASESPKASPGEREGRRSSVRGDEQIFSALRASRENTEHPLSQSLVASPDIQSLDIQDGYSYFTAPEPIEEAPSSSASSPGHRPGPERTTSTTDSIVTIRPPAAARASIHPPISEDLSQIIPQSGFTTSPPSGIVGILGGVGRRVARNMRSRDRRVGPESASESSRSSSVENMAASFEDSHATASIAVSSAMASGHMERPAALRDMNSIDRQTRERPRRETRSAGESSAESFRRAEEQNSRRHIQEVGAESHPSSRPSTIPWPCPPSPDDEISVARQQARPSQNVLLNISSDDRMTPTIGEPFSEPQTPAAGSGASSLSTMAYDQGHNHQAAETAMMATSETITSEMFHGKSGVGVWHAAKITTPADEDEAGYNGDGDEGEDDMSDDEGLVMGRN